MKKYKTTKIQKCALFLPKQKLEVATSPETKLSIIMTFNDLSDEEIIEAKKLLKEVNSWDFFWELTNHNRVVPLIYKNFLKTSLSNSLPENIRQKMEKHTKAIVKVNEDRLQIARQFLKRFIEKKIPVIILKGVNFAETIYKNPYYKQMNDIDILIKYEDIDKIYDIYNSMNFFSVGEVVNKLSNKKHKRTHHAPSFISPDLKCMIGTHWGLITPFSKYKYDYQAIWQRSRELNFYNIPVLSMSPEDNLHHICVHLPFYKTGLRELADIYNLIRYYSELNWELFSEIISKAKTYNPVYHALSLVNKIYYTKKIDICLEQIKPFCSFSYIKSTNKKIKSLDLIVRNRSTHLSNIEKDFSDLSHTQDPKEKLFFFSRIWKNIFWPPKEEVIKINYFINPNIFKIMLGRITTPIKILKVFINDLGLLIFLLAILKSTIDLLINLAKSPFIKKESKSNYENFAKKMGLTIEDLKNFKNRIE